MRRVLEAGLLCLATAAAGDTAYITCQSDDTLGIIDLTGQSEVGQWSVKGKPAGVAVTQGMVYTVSPDSKEIRRFDILSGEVLAQTRLDGGPVGVALDTGRNRLFVSDWYNARLFVLDATTLAPLQELPTGTAPAGLALSDDGRYLASADKEANQVSIFDAETLTTRHQPTVGLRPYGLRFDPGGRLFVGNVGSNDVTVIDPTSGEMLATIPVGERPYGVAFAGGRAFVTNQYENTVSVIDLTTLTHETKIDVGEYPEGIDTTPDGSRIVLANWFDNTVSVIDPKSLSVLFEVDTCDGPRAFGTFLLGGKE
ncbi:MAG: beta-propeller fold lactonase family protein [Pseudomonadota bacterium]